MENINGYIPLKPFSTVGAGTASWTIARKNGRNYFLKRFNSPKFMPSCADYCHKYEIRKTKLYKAIRDLDNGNLIVVDEFFRSDTFYYIATQIVQESSMTAEQAHKLPKESLLVIMKTLCHCMMRLENGGIVHADLKPSNVMLKATVGGFYSLKLIDFDSSFFVSDPPAEKDDLEGDMTYLSPEVLMGMCGEEVKLTSKIDVFAAGIMFHMFLCNELPKFDDEYDSVCEAVANGAAIQIHPSISDFMAELIRSMLDIDCEKRPSFSQLFRHLSVVDAGNLYRGEKDREKKTLAALSVKPIAEKAGNPWLKKAGEL